MSDYLNTCPSKTSTALAYWGYSMLLLGSISKQILFRTYAQYSIRGAVLDSLRTLDWSPRELRRKARAVEQAIQSLTAQFHRSPADIEIARS
jgi:DNA-directed RNA polymerase specialized sigma subunit